MPTAPLDPIIHELSTGPASLLAPVPSTPGLNRLVDDEIVRVTSALATFRFAAEVANLEMPTHFIPTIAI